MRFRVVLALLVGMTVPAQAAPYEDNLQLCADAGAPAAQRVRACSWLLSAQVLAKPAYAGIYFQRGSVHAAAGNAAAAIRDFTEVLARTPSDADALYARGTLYAETGEKDKALSDYNEAIRLRPDFAAAHYNRAILYYGEGDYAAAIAGFDRTIALSPDFGLAYAYRAASHEKAGNEEAAVRDFRAQYDRGSRESWLIERLKIYDALPQ